MVAALLALGLPACSSSSNKQDAASSSTSSTSPPSTAGAPTALVAALPEGCDAAAPAPSAVIAFVAGGRSWAVSPDDAASLRCLFPTSDAGLFSFGPLGDRVALSGLEVRGVGSNVSRPKSGLRPVYYSWSRPTGTTLVFTDGARKRLARADLGQTGSRDITPVHGVGVTYGDVAYHPSGLAIGFVVTDAAGAQLYLSTNQGQDAKLLVDGPAGTTFGHLVFAHDGQGLYYSIDRKDGSHTLARYNMIDGSVAPALWKGDAPVANIVELAGVPGMALTVGTPCANRRAVFSTLDGSAGQPLSGGVDGPTSIVGRLDADRFVVAAGGCDGPSDLYIVRATGGPPTRLVNGVEAATLRQPEPTPPPPLPTNLPKSEFA
ncbi:MAG TPA: hypothetical protein VG795_13835 [Acidimicrobiia bacterium]|nr:hypothetical protein [Acidimicrobiia bacterium]